MHGQQERINPYNLIHLVSATPCVSGAAHPRIRLLRNRLSRSTPNRLLATALTGACHRQFLCCFPWKVGSPHSCFRDRHSQLGVCSRFPQRTLLRSSTECSARFLVAHGRVDFMAWGMRNNGPFSLSKALWIQLVSYHKYDPGEIFQANAPASYR